MRRKDFAGRKEIKTVIVLAGGRSSRLGKDKAKLRLNSQTLLERALSNLKEKFRELIVVTNDRGLVLPEAKVVWDRVPYQGPLGGILAGLIASTSSYNLVVACDMPFIQPALVELLVDESEGFDVVMPQTERGPEPLLAVYSKNCLPSIEKHWAAGDLKIISFLGEAKVKYIAPERVKAVDPKEISFFNVNTEEDLKEAKRRLGEER